MQNGNWIPLDKSLARSFPRKRAFSEIEAMFSLSLDYDKGNFVTVSGYASRWGWSRKKVKRFLERVGVEISYPENTARKQNQKGQIRVQIRDRSGTDRVADKGQIRIIDSKWLRGNRNRSGTDRVADQEQIRDRSGSATIDPNPNPNPKNGPPNPPPQSCQSPDGYESGGGSGGRPKFPTQELLEEEPDAELRDAFLDCRDFLGMSDEEIKDIYSICSDHKKFCESVRYAGEKNFENLLDSPSGFILWAYKKGKTSKKTRQAVAGNSLDVGMSEQVRMTIEQCEETERNQRSGAYIADDPCPEDEIPF